MEQVKSDLFYLTSSSVPFKKFVNGVSDFIGENLNRKLGIQIKMPTFSLIMDELKDKEEKFIFIFDDYERRNVNINNQELLGFIENLYVTSSNVKIIIIGNIKTLEMNGFQLFNNFKEKVIDKVYTFEESKEEIKQKILGESFYYNTKDLIQKYNLQNLRTFNKCKLFYNQIISKTQINVAIHKDLIKLMMEYLLITIFQIEQNLFKEIKLEMDKDYDGFMSEEEDLRKIVKSVYNYNSFNFNILKKIYNYYKYEEIEQLKELIDTEINEKTKGKSYLLKTSKLFFLSSDKKKEEIKNIITEMEKDEITAENIKDIVEGLAKIINYNMNYELKLSLSLNVINENIINFYVDSKVSDGPHLQDILDIPINFEKSEEVVNHFSSLTEIINNKIYTKLSPDIIESFNKKNITKLVESLPKYILYYKNEEKFIKEIYKNNDLLLILPKGDLSYSQWRDFNTFIDITKELNDTELKDDFLQNISDKIQNCNDITIKKRLILLKEYFLDIPYFG
jgi:hypothetical protein